MTTILMRETPSKVEIAYDSQVSIGSFKEEMDFPKVFTAGDITYGVAGAVRTANLISSSTLKAPPTTHTVTETHRWVVRVLVPHLQSLCTSLSPIGAFENEAQILAVVNAHIFEIGSDFSVVRNTSGVYGIGSGGHIARTAIVANPSLTAKEAVSIAANHDSFTGMTIHSKVISR